MQEESQFPLAFCKATVVGQQQGGGEAIVSDGRTGAFLTARCSLIFIRLARCLALTRIATKRI